MINLIAFLKQIRRNILYGPVRGIGNWGPGTQIARPRNISGAKYIHIGARTSIRHYSHIIAIEKYANIQYSPEIRIGNDVYIGGYVHIHCIGKIVIGDGCVLSESIYISDQAHGLDPEKGLIMEQPLIHKGNVEIGDNTFLGFGVTVLPGVTLGKNCIVGTRSVVTKSFPDYSMIVGSPAKLIKKYSLEKKEWIPILVKDDD